MYKLNELQIGSVKYPYIIDLNVLEEIQETFGTVGEFERQILGIELIKDDDGNVLFDKDGKPKMKVKDPSIKAINTVLPMMVNEGILIQAERDGREPVVLTRMQVVSECTLSYRDLANLIHDEFERRFEAKK